MITTRSLTWNLSPAISRIIMLDPVIFHQAAKQLKFKPSVDLFATADHHQVERYFAPQRDAHAAAINAFSVDWRREWHPYANHPWPLIAQVLNKVLTERVSIMVVVPDWPKAPWHTLWQQLCTRSILFTNPVFLDAHGRLRQKPRWNTRVGTLDGNRL